MLGWLADLFTELFDTLMTFLSDILAWFITLVVTVITALLDMLKDLAFWLFAQILQLLQSILDGLDFAFDFNLQALINEIPVEILQVLSLIRIPEAMTIIVGAYMIRVGLRAIPYVGSIFK